MNTTTTSLERPSEAAGAATATAGQGGRLLALDGLRGIAIAMVMLYHFDFLYRLHFTDQGASLVLLDDLVSKTLGAGWAGVDLFFVLSGFLITGILYDAKGPARRFFASFYARRSLRIFPAYYGFLALLLVSLPLLGETDAAEAILRVLPWYGSYLTNVRDVIDSGLRPDFLFAGHIWSLAVEEQFYLVWPAFVFLFNRRTLLWVSAAGIVVAVTLRVGFELADQPSALAYVLTPARMDALAVGAVVALVARGPGSLRRLRRWAPALAAISLAVLLVLGVLNDGLSPQDAWVRTLGFSALALLFAAVLALVAGRDSLPFVRAALGNAGLRWLGRHSYGAYLLHLPAATLLARRADAFGDVPDVLGSTLPGEVIFFAAAGAISLALAWLSWQLWESRFLRLKRWFPYRESAASGPAPVVAAAADPLP